uniref:DNA binding HTH domain-containing protein n=1 Tax=Eiseniibacteriota bacterium TaxID=2212470 RepID=A0A832I0X2_UNCEI
MLSLDANRRAVARALTEECLGACDGVLARLWLPGPGDRCATCPFAIECPDRTWCLHLVTGAGLDARTEGRFARFPVGARRVGEVARAGAPLLAVEELPRLGLADPAWLATHRVASFAAVPVPHDHGRNGVLAVFARRALHAGEVACLALAARWAGPALAAGAGAGSAAPPAGAAGGGLPPPTGAAALARPPATAPAAGAAPPPAALRTLAEIEREAIERALAHTGGRVSGPRGAALILGLKPTTLESRMKKLGVRKPRP